jgi:hypothetical protein
LWTIWGYLSWLQRSFLFILLLVSIHCVYTTVVIMVRLRSKATLNKQRELVTLQSRNAALHQMIEAAFYLFGIVLFLGLQFAHWVIGDGPRPIAYQIINHYLLHFAFAANVFVIFLFLHCMHWIGSARLRSLCAAPQ